MKQLTENEMMSAKTLAYIQEKVKVSKKNFNQFGKYKYRRVEDILDCVKPVINPLGYWLTLSDEVNLLGNRFYIKSTAKLTNGVQLYMCDGWAREDEQKKGMDSSQITGSSSSYARKRALEGLFALSSEADMDELSDNDDLSAWEDAINYCKTLDELMGLYKQNEKVVEDNPSIKKLFANKKKDL